jgi:hypothetical protein
MTRARKLARRWGRIAGCLLVAAALTPEVVAAPPVAVINLTVDQLDQLLKQIHGQPDAKVARRITGIKLTERAGAARIANWESELAGDRSREALMAVTDDAAFLAPPAAETRGLPAPDAQTQHEILARCSDYVRQRVSRLPNYIALRTTTAFAFATAEKLKLQQYANGPLLSKEGQNFRFQALGPAKSSESPEDQYFWLGSLAQEVTYRGGIEVVSAAPGANGPSRSTPNAMTTSGEFGSVLGVIVDDISEDRIAWDHWEQGRSAQGHSVQGTGGTLAVFHFSVPSEKSHVAVVYADGSPNFPAYHGEVAIDPESGAVWRIKILAIISESGFFGESSQVVEFAPTEIAGLTYICPVHSVAIMRYFDTSEYGNTAHAPVPFQISINDVLFTNYHQFRSESHIITGASGP